MREAMSSSTWSPGTTGLATKLEAHIEYGAEGLTVLWEPRPRDASTPGPPVMVPDYDIVVLHGLHGARQPPWKNPGSGDSSWLPDAGVLDGRKVMSFGYQSSKILAGRLTRQAIRKVAQHLLDDLAAERRNSSEMRPLMFIMHDIGGIILKDALIVAGLNPQEYGNIFDFTRVLVFYGCPHWATGYTEMEDGLSLFIFRHVHEYSPAITASVESIRGLAGAISDVNSLFIDVKQCFRCYIFSIYADADDISESGIDKAFNVFHSTLGMPFEIRLAGRGARRDGEAIGRHLIKLQHQLTVNPSIIGHERSLLSIAAPMPSLFTADEPGHRFAWISENSTYTRWLNQKRPQILYVYGKTHVRDAAEFIYYNLDQTRSRHRNEIVLYFTFNRWDLRRDSAQDMLTNFQVQIIGHFPSLAEFVISQFRQLGEDRSWNNSDLVNWFEYYRLRGEFDGISCVIDRFDECDKDSRATFLKHFASVAKVHERPWRVVVTGQEQEFLLHELPECATLDLDAKAPPNPETVDDQSPETRAIVKRRPELRGSEDIIEKEITSLDTLKPIVRDLIREYISAQEDWPTKQSIESTFGRLVAETATPAAILNKIVKEVPDRSFAMQALSWILYSRRPATIWEIAAVIFVNSDDMDGDSAFPTREYIDHILAKITTQLAGIVIVEQHELHIRTIGLRQILLSQQSTDGSAVYPWEEFARTVHADIAETCIKYLVRPQVRKHLEGLYKQYGGSESSVLKLPTHCDRTSLSDYASKFWAYHLALVPEDQKPKRLLNSFLESDVVDIWMWAYWAASNPIKRSSEPLKSVYPLLAGVGLAEVARPWCDRDENMSSDEKLSTGLIEAYLSGNSKAVRYLLPLIDHDIKALQDCLIAAGSRGIEEQWMDLILHIEKAHGKDFAWPETLVTRATWLGLDSVVAKLLSLGCRIETDKSSTQMPSPLLLVAWTGSPEVTKTLLNAKHRADVRAIGEEGRTGLHLAACFGHPEVASLLQDAGADVNGRDRKGLTPVYLACLWGNYAVVEKLCSLGADPNIGDTDDGSPDETWYPLLVAAEEGYYKCARALLKGGANPNIVGAGGTPLRHAVKNGLPELCYLLIRNGADPNHSGIEPPILYQAVASHEPRNRLEIVRLLVENNARINVAHADGTTALSWTCWNDDDQKAQLAVIEYLLDHGADVNRADRRGVTPLQVAVRRHNAALVRLLLKRGADVNGATSNNGLRTPLSSATASEEITQLLLGSGADPNRQGRPGENSALVWAIMAQQTGVARMLLEHGANPDAALAAAELSPSGRRDDSVWTAMALAAAWKLPDMVRLLGDAGANVDHRLRRNGRSVVHVAAAANEATLTAVLEFHPQLDVRDEDGDTPLHVTAGRGPEHLGESKRLVRANVDVNLVNTRGLSPLARAVQEGDAATAKFLINRGASVNIASSSHGGPLHLACQGRRLDLVRTLVAAEADVNLAVPGTAGTPLQSALLGAVASTGTPDRDIDDPTTTADELVLFLLDEAKADPSSPGGRFGSAIAVAAWKASVAMLSLLLEQGACATARDSMERTAVHLAALRRLGTINDGHKDADNDDNYDHIGLILDAGGDVGWHDMAGRSVLHWAAQGEGGARMLERVLKILGEGGRRGQEKTAVVDECDAGGWTPLCWAARAGRVEAVRELLRQGADRRVRVRVRGKGEEEFGTPLDIARYHSAGDELVALLLAVEENGSDGEAAQEKGEDGREGVDSVPRKEQQSKRTHAAIQRRANSWDDEWCDCCLLGIVGFKYRCKTCTDFNLCYKCHDSRGALHPAQHSFAELGPEFGRGLSLGGFGSSSTDESYTESDSEGGDEDGESLDP